MKVSFDVAKNSLQNPNKLKNGDYCQSHFLTDENILIVVLCDGVGSNACDWKASKIGCEFFIENFKNGNPSNITQRITQAIEAVNQEILLEVGSCENMKSTFTTVVWEFDANKFHYVSIGDSRIYEYDDNFGSRSRRRSSYECDWK